MEAICVGVATVIIGTLVGSIIGKYLSVDLPALCTWNNHIMVHVSF